jgi:pullulanase
LYDKLLISVSGKAARIKAFRMSNAIIMLAQGMPFMQAGQEFMRSKDVDENSYQSPDSTNSLKWNMRTKNASMVNYFKGLIALRKAHPAFRLRTEDQVKNVLSFISTKQSVIAYTLDGAQAGDSWAKIVVIHNAGSKAARVSLPVEGNWKLVVDEARTGTTVLKMFKHATSVSVPAQSTYVLYR